MKGMFDEKALKLMAEMMNAFGPSGFEREVNSLLKRYMNSISDEVLIDKLGTMAFVSRGSSPKPRVLMTGHTDEVGFIVSSITEEGYLTFNQLGGWWDQVLLGQRVIVRGSKGDIQGIIAAKPPHILPEEDRKKVVEKKDMFIDIGSTSRRPCRSLQLIHPHPGWQGRDGKSLRRPNWGIHHIRGH